MAVSVKSFFNNSKPLGNAEFTHKFVISSVFLFVLLFFHFHGTVLKCIHSECKSIILRFKIILIGKERKHLSYGIKMLP